MAVIFRSADLPVGDREPALRSAFMDQIWPTTVDLADPRVAHSTLENWEIGQTTIFCARLEGMSLNRSARQVRSGPSEMLTIAMQTVGVGRFAQFGHHTVVRTGELMLVDMNEPYDFSWDGAGSSLALYLPLEEIGLPREVVTAAATRLPASPMYPLMTAQIGALAADGDAVHGTAAATELGNATVDLARAMIASAFDADYARGTMAEVLLPRIRGHIRRHLTDPTLSPDSIAHAHNISVRKLFRLCEEADFSLEQWIISRRLEGSRGDFSRPELDDVSIAAVARRWGFTNPSYFSRRFRAAYGLTPKAWREMVNGG